MSGDVIVLDTDTGEEILASEAKKCDTCGAVHHKDGPIDFERGELDGFCGHWTCDGCAARARTSRWSGIKGCAACEKESR